MTELAELEKRLALMETKVAALEMVLYGSRGGVQYGAPVEIISSPEAAFVNTGGEYSKRDWLASLHQDNEQPTPMPKGHDAIKKLMEDSIKAGWEDWDRKWDHMAAQSNANRGDPLTFSIDGQLIAWVNLDGTIGGDPAALLSKSYALPLKGNVASLVAAARLMVRAIRADPTMHSSQYRPTGR